MAVSVMTWIMNILGVLIPFVFGLLAVTGAIVYPIAIDILETSGIYPERIVVNTGLSAQCNRIGEDLNIACEDVAIHHPSGTAFLACDDHVARRQYWPPLNLWNTSYAGTGRIYALDLKTSELTKLKIDGLPTSLTTHGIGIWWDPKSPNDVVLNIVNHHPDGSTIEILDHQIGTTTLTHAETFNSTELLRAPNAVLPVGKRSFYATNDHVHLKGFGRSFEDATFTILAGESSIVGEKLKYADGIAASPDYSEIYVTSLGDHAVFVNERKPNGNLRHKGKVVLDFFPHNIKVHPKSGYIYVAGTPKPFDTLKHFQDGSHNAPTWVSRITKNTRDTDRFLGRNFVSTIVLSDAGDNIFGGSSAAVDPETQKTVITGFFSDGVTVCEDAFDTIKGTRPKKDRRSKVEL
ncbi:hypothetical protein BC829DRAFT_383429 [Chytridium lagenaria]|nr:hypothetical protein BC829DRAFT_383429 [Chytridium lagenaria]